MSTAWIVWVQALAWVEKLVDASVDYSQVVVLIVHKGLWQRGGIDTALAISCELRARKLRVKQLWCFARRVLAQPDLRYITMSCIGDASARLHLVLVRAFS